MDNIQLEKHAKNVRVNILKMVTDAKSGHPGGSLSAADILTYLYLKEMNITKENLNELNRDRFVLSKGHVTPALYAVLAEKNLIEKEELKSFRKINSKLQGHPNMNDVEAVDMSTGSLGQGFSAAVGMALAKKVDNDHHHVYVLLGDGECEEGQVWEAAMAAAHYKLNQLCAIVDYNQLQIDGAIQDVMNPTPIDEKFRAFGWHVLYANGHDMYSLEKAFNDMRQIKDQPVMILASTVKGKGVSFMENQAKWHGTAPTIEQYEQAVKEIMEAK